MILDDAFLPAGLALLASVMFGISNVAARRGLKYADPQAGACVSIGVCALWFLACAPWWWMDAQWLTPGFWVFVLNGLFHPMLSIYLAYEANERAGATVAATFAATAPLFAAVIAVMFIGETVTLGVGLGTALTVAGIMRLSWSPGAYRAALRSALLFASGAALIRAGNQGLTKFGLELLPNAIFAALVSFSVAFIGTVIIYRCRFGTFPLPMARRGVQNFAVAGTGIAVAIWGMFSALGMGDIVVVSPIVTSFPIFTLLAAVAVGEERATWLVVSAVLMVVAGVGLIGVSSVTGF